MRARPVRTRPVFTRGQKTREGTASAVCNRHDRWHRGQLLETMSSFDAEKRPGEKCGLGHDLPGAVGVVREDHVDDPRHTPTSPKYWDDSPDVLRFSLAGVQLKFSAIETAAGGLTIPARGMGGDWILKLPSVHYDAVPENEYSMMTLAREVGIEVPETRLVPMGRVEGLPPEAVDGRIADMNALAVRRYDRTGTVGYTPRTSHR